MSYFHANILTLFPSIFPGPLQYSLAGRALANNIWSYKTVNIKNYGITKHHKIDDKPYGGGNGLVMKADVIGKALDDILEEYNNCPIYYPSPRGAKLTQNMVKEISSQSCITFICGRFEGIDERIIDEYNVVQFSVGDYILSCGDVAVLALLDSIVRLLPGVVKNRDALLSESFEQSEVGSCMLEEPLYTRPRLWKGRNVPDVLLSGNHKEIAKWRSEKSFSMTKRLRPDLL